MFKNRSLLVLILLALTLLASACNRSTQPPASETTPQTSVVEMPTDAVPTELPTATPILILDAELLLWAPESADQAMADQTESALRV